ncbi:MAG TPA: hypothetical protein VGI03_04335 [Verrucomicrobiae bacterium]|jgi:hypothetical protein
MPRNPKIEAILEAWIESEICQPPHRNEALKKLNGLIDGVIGETNFSRTQILDFLYPRFKELKAKKRKELKIAVAQSAGL